MVLAQPTAVGPKKPPRLPIELIQAMPDAAAVPVRIIEGNVQNGPLLPYRPIVAIDMPTKAHAVPIVLPAMTRPIAATTQAQNRFQRRSPMRSEIQPQTSMLIAPQM